ncbi:hypothetical protein C0Q70_05191 [Pomacea canaliculata]|uniref:Uncharacterized protein n=1 Tax=Pomacea canaliculata TaxID=400727 RepID=A0A2T7PKH0_POMCA|nr:hypothetical protein C0Q70_05191 [Pomacea canaliculata]
MILLKITRVSAEMTKDVCLVENNENMKKDAFVLDDNSSSTPASGSILTSSSAAHQGEPSHASRLQRVSSSSYFDIANTILGSSGDLDEVLLCAARDGDLNKLEQLLCQRNDIIVDVDCKDRRTGNTALILAAKKGYAKMIQLLLRHGADPTLHNYEAQTALEVATSATKTILLDWVNRSTECTHRLLLQAAWQGNLEVIRRLLVVNKSLDINCQNAEGLTPLLLVAKDVQLFERLGVQLNRRYNPVEVAELLIKARAHTMTIQLTAVTLLQHGADITLTDDRGMTAVDLAKTRKMKTTLREAWAEATQKCKPAELGPVRVTSREESKLYMHEENHKARKGEVVFEDSLSRAMTKGRRAEQQTLQDIENGKYTPTPVYSRESTRPLGTVRTKMPSILPQISKQSPSPAGCQSPESPPAGSRNAAEDLRRSLEDGRNMLDKGHRAEEVWPVRAGRLSGSTPLSTSEKMDDNTRDNFSAIDMNMYEACLTQTNGSDPVSTTSIGDLAVSADNIISRRGRSVSTGDGESCEMGGTSTERMSQLRTPLDRDTTMCVNIPPMIPEGNSPRNPTNVLSYERNVTNSQGSTMPVQIIPLPPNSSRILPPTPTFLTQGSFIAVEGALAKAMKDDDSLSSKEPSPRSDDDDDNKIRMVLANPMELFRSRSLLKEEFILAESRPSDIVVGEKAASLGARSGIHQNRRSDPSLVNLGETKGLAGQSSVRNANISPKSQKDCKGADAAEKGMKCSASDTVLGSGFLSTAECGETFSNLKKFLLYRGCSQPEFKD